MNGQIREYLEKYPTEIIEMYVSLRNMIFISASDEPEETMWARIPSYYVGDKFVRLIPFKDHINIEASAISLHKEELWGYKITPKGMLQIYVDQSIPNEVLSKIFAESLK